jgi:hypothetical protein
MNQWQKNFSLGKKRKEEKKWNEAMVIFFYLAKKMKKIKVKRSINEIFHLKKRKIYN